MNAKQEASITKKQELLVRITGRLVGIAYDDLTTAEKSIADILIANS
jgi:hypothetical protein